MLRPESQANGAIQLGPGIAHGLNQVRPVLGLVAALAFKDHALVDPPGALRLDDGLHRLFRIVATNVNGGVVAGDRPGHGRVIIEAAHEQDRWAAGVIDCGAVHVRHFSIIGAAPAALGNRVVTAEDPDATSRDHSLRVIESGGLDELRECVKEQVGGRAAGVIPVTAELEEPSGVPISLGGKLLAGADEAMAEPPVPIEPGRFGILDGFPLAIIAPGPGGVVPVVTRRDHHHLADAVFLDVLVDLVEELKAGRLDPHLNADLVLVLLFHFGKLQGLLDGVAHRLFEVNVLARLDGVDGKAQRASGRESRSGPHRPWYCPGLPHAFASGWPADR